MAVVIADRGGCEGYGNCSLAAPDVFDIDDEGVVVLLRERVSEEERPRVQEAALSCPVSALRVDDE